MTRASLLLGAMLAAVCVASGETQSPVVDTRTPGQKLIHLLRAENLGGEPVAMARQRALDAIDAQQIHADARNGGAIIAATHTHDVDPLLEDAAARKPDGA